MMKTRTTVVKKSPKFDGLGVFATKDIKKGGLIGTYPCIAADKDSWGTALEDYLFARDDIAAIALGSGSLFNHARDPNAEFYIDDDMRIMTVRASRNINKNEEILISYGDAYWDTRYESAR